MRHNVHVRDAKLLTMLPHGLVEYYKSPPLCNSLNENPLHWIIQRRHIRMSEEDQIALDS